MATTPTQKRIDSDIKLQATELFKSLGLDMSTAVNMFLHQAVIRQGLPFPVELPHYKPEVIEAMDEALRLSRDPSAKRYSSFEEALKDIDL